MKRFYAAAGALLLGTSALALAADTAKDPVEPTKVTTEAKTAMSGDKSMLATKTDLSTDAKLATASLDTSFDKLASHETGAKLQTASFADGKAWSDGDAKLQTAAMTDNKVDAAWSDSDKLQFASAEADAKVQTAAFDKVETGMGGPLEDEIASTVVVQPSNANPELDARGIPVISDVAFVPPGYNGVGGAVGGPVEGGDDESYPACTAARTDNCIQLYERGVRASLVSAQSGSLNGGSETGAMGGPYEPVDADSTGLAMNGDGLIDAGKGETSDLGVQAAAAAAATATVAGHSDFQGVGGPVEAQSGYPPCSPGPGDDRCIQLYERGVTGAGN